MLRVKNVKMSDGLFGIYRKNKISPLAKYQPVGANRWGDTAISRKVVEKNVHTTIPKGSMEYNQCTVPDCIQLLNLLRFPLSFSNIHPWPLVPFFEISLKNSELQTTHNFGIFE